MMALSAMFETREDMHAANPDTSWPFAANEWLDWLSREAGEAPYFITQDGEKIGHFSLRMGDVPEQRHLAWLILKRAYRGGQGRKILSLAEQAARGRFGAKFMTLRVDPKNARAKHIYTAFGYRIVHEATDNYLMRKDLT